MISNFVSTTDWQNWLVAASALVVVVIVGVVMWRGH
jgi:hypothetical protein